MCQNSAISHHESVEEMLTALSLFTKQNLDIGTVNSQISKDAKLLLLRQGELQNSQGKKLTPGDILANPPQENWQATEPTIAYILRQADWQQAVQHWTQLSTLIAAENIPISEPIRREVQPKNRNVIQFPQPKIQPQPQPKQRPKQRQKYFPSPTVTASNWW
ncbi:MAG: ABC transporter ATP-binding protein, partial [Sphaerospermopsis kisseleviana]